MQLVVGWESPMYMMGIELHGGYVKSLASILLPHCQGQSGTTWRKWQCDTYPEVGTYLEVLDLHVSTLYLESSVYSFGERSRVTNGISTSH